MKWISEQLAELAKALVIVSTRIKDEDMDHEHRIERPATNVFRFAGEMANCNATENSECGLASVLRKENAYCKEFTIEKVRLGTTTNRSVEVVIDDKPEYPYLYSCPKCFYNQCVLALLDRVEYSPIEIELPIGQQPLARLYLVGLVEQESKDKAKKNVLLTLKCTIDSKERTFLVAFKGTSVCYMEVVLRSGGSGREYDIDQESDLRSGLNYDSKVSVLSVDQIHFVNEDGIIDNFYRTRQENIDSAFKIYYLQITSSPNHRETITRKMPLRSVQSTSTPQPKPSHLWKTLGSIVSHPSFKVTVAISFVWAAVLLLRESQVQRTARAKVSVL